ncbi:hypothetical protein [Flavobacterium sp.]|uniref:hypothetical protein n=1 Tax=Flavobacterium sp. TaxID=239 RepID=UPI0025E4F578|nr:hypothetical protein [Flavobacterium sp.]
MKTFSKVNLVMVLLVFTSFIFANTVTPVITNSTINAPSEAAKTEVLLNRLNDIKNMDKTNLSRADKKDLRKEVKVIKGEMKRSSNGIYLSIGAIIIIVLVLILIL